MPDTLEIIYALLWIFGQNRPSIVKRGKRQNQKVIKEKQSKLNTKTRKKRELIHLSQSLVSIISPHKHNDFLRSLEAVNVTFWRPKRKKQRILNFLLDDFFLVKWAEKEILDKIHTIQHSGEHRFQHELLFFKLTFINSFLRFIFLCFFASLITHPFLTTWKFFFRIWPNLPTKFWWFNNNSFLRLPFTPTKRFKLRSRVYETSVTKRF